MSENTLLVKIDQFEGPLDLLLYLINKNEIEIYNINITKITTEYLSYIEEMKKLDLNIASEYIVMAATLIKIKSDFMLPKYGDDENIEDPRRPLIERLLEYQKIKKASEVFRNIETEARKLFGRNIDLHLKDYIVEEELSIVDLMNAFTPILKKGLSLTSYRIPSVKKTIGEKIAEITQILKEDGELNISAYLMMLDTMYEVILTFITVLEMTNKHLVKLAQKEQYEDIWVKQY